MVVSVPQQGGRQNEMASSSPLCKSLTRHESTA